MSTDLQDRAPVPHYVEEAELDIIEDLNRVAVNLSRFSVDGHSWNGKPMVNVWENF